MTLWTKPCDTCQGCGGIPDDETGEAEQCWDCRGVGRVDALEEWWCWLRVWIDVRIAEPLRFSRVGSWYWERWGKRCAARRLVRDRSPLALAVLHGERLTRYRKFADILESNQEFGRGLAQEALRRERRLVKEAAEACRMAEERAARRSDTWDER